MQAPGRPDEDTRGGFEFSGWATPPPHPWRRPARCCAAHRHEDDHDRCRHRHVPTDRVV